MGRYSTLCLLFVVIHVASSIRIKTPAPEPAPLSIQVFSVSSPKPDLDVSLKLELDPSWKVLGGGATTKLMNETLISATYPVNSYTWFARAHQGEFNTPSNLAIYVVAIYDPKNLLEHAIFIGKSQASSPAPNASAVVADGYTLTGGGAQVTDVADFTAFLYATYPSANNAWVAQASFPQKTGEAWISSYAIGIRPNSPSVSISGQTISKLTSAKNSYPTSMLYNYADTQITGGGAFVNYKVENWGPLAGNFLWQSIPVADITGEKVVGWTASSKDQMLPTPSVITVYFVSMTIKSK